MVTLSMNFMSTPSIGRSSGRHRGPQQKGAHLTEELGDLDQETTRDALSLARRRVTRCTQGVRLLRPSSARVASLASAIPTPLRPIQIATVPHRTCALTAAFGDPVDHS